ncbi:ChaN family lipoprotein [Cobetia marina]|uniref:ChaN family lipoprotein n=1 Tax=Cobetia marina TaxID=28258 RepID=A0ABU9GIZ3_COBMA
MSLFHRPAFLRPAPAGQAGLTRRQLLAGMVAGAGGLSLLGSGALQAAQAPPGPLPPLPAWHDPDASHPLLGSILVAQGNRRLSPAALVDWAQAHPLVLLGEHHDNPDHHLLERWLIDALAARRQLGGVAMEMLDSRQDAALSLVNRTSLAVAGLPDEELMRLLAWDARWNFTDYSSVLRGVLDSGAPLSSASLTREQVRAVMAQDQTAPALPEAVLRLQREALDEGHCGLLGAERLDGLLRAQLARDQQMAERLEALANRDATALLVAGSGHARRDIGVPRWLTRDSLSIALMPVAWGEEGQPLTQLDDYLPESAGAAPAYDLVWFTPAVAQTEDACAGLREAADIATPDLPG